MGKLAKTELDNLPKDKDEYLAWQSWGQLARKDLNLYRSPQYFVPLSKEYAHYLIIPNTSSHLTAEWREPQYDVITDGPYRIVSENLGKQFTKPMANTYNMNTGGNNLHFRNTVRGQIYWN